MNNSERIVLAGMACRLPDADSANEFWHNLLAGTVSTKKVRRWSDNTTAISGFLDNPDAFDAAFFNVSPNEARCMSPQLRQLLEVSYQAIESSGLSIKKLAELNTGVFCTALPGDYKNLLAKNSQAAVNPYSFSGNAFSAISGRLSYFYDFHGPSIAIDTACSSGLTALHLAQLSIKNGDCDAALVGGVSIFSTSEFHTLASSSHMLSSTNECAAFDEKADGFVASEGVVCLLLLGESKARELGVPIYGSIKAIGLNHNGLSNGLMAPNAKQQEALIKKTYEKAGVSLSDVALFETHGTATKLGDSLEIRGLTNALPQESDCYLGASKMIIGHTLVCSALASVIKTALAHHYQIIPPNPLFQKVNSLFVLPKHLIINNQPMPWPEGTRYASISAYGFTGSNGHLIMEFTPGLSRDLPLPYSFEQSEYHVQLHQKKATFIQTYSPELQACIDTLCEVLSYQNGSLDVNKSLAELGVDSLTALTFVNKLKERGFKASNDKVWSTDSVLDFAGQLASESDTAPGIKVVKPFVDTEEETISPIVIPGMIIHQQNDWNWVCHREGGGRPIILLPPLNSDYKAWLRQIPLLLKQDYQLYIPYYPGHDGRAFNEPLVLTELAKRIADFASSLHEPPHFVGWSLGGILSILIAIQDSALLKSMTLIACTTEFDESLFEKTIEMQEDLQSHSELLKIAFQTNHSITDYISCKTPMSLLKDYYQELIRLSIPHHDLAQIKVPAQIILGKKDPVINERQIEHLKKIPHQNLTVFENAGHFVPITLTAEFNPLLTSFMRSVEHNE